MKPIKEVSMKVWRQEEAMRLGVGESAVANRLSRGKYQHLKIRRENKRKVFVEIE